MVVEITHRLSYPAVLHMWILQLAGVPPEADGLIHRFIRVEEEHVKLAGMYVRYGGYPPSWNWMSEFQKLMMIADSVEEACRFIREDEVREAYLKLAEYMRPYFEKYRRVSEKAMEYCRFWTDLLVDGIEDMLDALGLEHRFTVDVYHIPYPHHVRTWGKGGANIPGESAVYVWDGLENFKTPFYYSTLWHEVFHVLLRETISTRKLGPLNEILCNLISSMLDCKYFLCRYGWQTFLIPKISVNGEKCLMKAVIEEIGRARVERKVLDKTIQLKVESPSMTLIFEGLITAEKGCYEIEVDDELTLVDYRNGKPVFRLMSNPD